MTYATIQTAALAVLRKLTEFDTGNSHENDYRPLSVGKQYHVVLSGGDTSNRSMQDIPANGVYQKRSDRLVNIEIFVMYEKDLYTTRQQLNTITQTVLDHLDKWPNLDQTVGLIETDADSTPSPETFTQGRWRYLVQKIPLNIIEFETVTLA